jgi:hypothetical protein
MMRIVDALPRLINLLWVCFDISGKGGGKLGKLFITGSLHPRIIWGKTRDKIYRGLGD